MACCGILELRSLPGYGRTCLPPSREEVVRMKRTVALALVFAFVLTFTTPVLALTKPIDKAYHGVEKIIKAPMHLVKDPVDEYKASTFKPFGLMGGIMKGISYTVLEAVHGTFEVVTSPFTLLEK